jgi:PAS domain S-box-containing protein
LLAPADDGLDDARRLLRDVIEHVPAIASITNLHPVADDREQDANRLTGFSLDVTTRRAAEEALAENEQMLAAVMKGSPDMILVTDLGGRITFVSDAAAEQLGVLPAEAVGRSLLEWLHPDDHRASIDTTRALVEGRVDVAVLRARAIHRDGRVMVVDSRANLLRRSDGEIIGLLGMTRDATPELEVEQVLREARDEAQRANRARDDFLSRMSHELRTPLNAVLGFAQLLEGALTEPRDLESVAHIRRAGSHLLRLLDEVLDLARIESGSFRVDVSTVALGGAVEEALAFVRPMAQSHGVRIDAPLIGDDAWVAADRPRLVQVLLNLLSNAVKFNRTGGHVAIDITPSYDGATWNVAVTDTGLGLTPDELGQLFTPFERLGADARGVAGTGIGLVLSRSLVERMGGSVTVSSEPGRGSTFAVTLRRTEPESISVTPDGPGAERSIGRRARPLSVLYIEDNAANRDLIRHALAAAGTDRLVLAPTGLEGVTAAVEAHPDVVLLDLHLPDVDGVDVLHRIRSFPGLEQTPVVVISADATRRQIKRVLAEGANHYLTKPIDLAELLAVIDGYR